MYEKDDLVIYGDQGVCRIESIGVIDLGMLSQDKEYYTLIPVFRGGKTYTPIDTKVHMRPLITVEEIDELIESYANIETVAQENQTPQQLINYYKQMIDKYSCDDLLRIIHSIDVKKEVAESLGKKIGQVDVRYKKEAKDLLSEEFAVVLGISEDDAMQYLNDNLKLAV